ncbi:MAG: hypothetical protein L7V87_05900 [Verrucomicrobiales bacterium]|nr:hypothetical protein [Verrucomicrobiales bacterium]
MAELARQIIKQQWSKRHDPDPGIQAQAVDLIKPHVVMIRSWEKNATRGRRRIELKQVS